MADCCIPEEQLYSIVGIETAMEKFDLRYDGLLPILAVMISGRGQERVSDSLGGHGFVQIAVDIIKEILGAAVENDSVAFGIDLVFLDESNDSVVFPSFRIFFLGAEKIGHVPSFWERTDIHTAGSGAGIAEEFRMAQPYPKTSVTAHAQASDGSLGRGAARTVVLVDPRDEFFGDVAFHLHCGIDGRIPIP